MSLTYKLAR